MSRSPSEEVSAPAWVLHGQQLVWEYVLHHGAPSPSTLAFPLVFRTLLFPSPLSLWCFLPFLKYVLLEAPPVWVVGSAVSCGGCIGDPAGARASPGLLPQRHPCSFPAAKTLPLIPNTKLYTHYQKTKITSASY